MKNTRMKLGDISHNPGEPLAEIDPANLMPLVGLDASKTPLVVPPTGKQKQSFEFALDGVSAIGLRKPETKQEEEKLVASFLGGLQKLLSKEGNWPFLQPLVLSLENCVKCQNCSESCPIYVSSGRQEIYRPNYRSEVLRNIIRKYVNRGTGIFPALTGSDIELNWTLIARLAELSYRCTICRRCAQACPIGIDNGLITRELRKLFSQEMGIAPKELHQKGTVQQLNVGASTGVTPKTFKSMVAFMEDDIEDRTGKKIKIPVDKEGADILLVHNSGEYLSWPENPEAFAIIFEAAGLSWTLCSELGGYEATNYGLWYDDVQFARILLTQAQVARKMNVKKVVIGECGHAHKAMIVIGDRLLGGDAVPAESCFPLLDKIVSSGKLALDPRKNDFPVTLHDPCNVSRLMGIIEPQRRIVRKLAPQFREMTPHGAENYCCGGGSGFAIMDSMNFPDWRAAISGRMKMKQIMDVFRDVMDPGIHKYICAPCSNCKGQIRDLLQRYDVGEKQHIIYGGLVELIVNAMADIKKPFITWEQ